MMENKARERGNRMKEKYKEGERDKREGEKERVWTYSFTENSFIYSKYIFCKNFGL